MDKRHVIAAYRQGRITLVECAQILGMEAELAAGLLGEFPERPAKSGKGGRKRQPVGG